MRSIDRTAHATHCSQADRRCTGRLVVRTSGQPIPPTPHTMPDPTRARHSLPTTTLRLCRSPLTSSHPSGLSRAHSANIMIPADGLTAGLRDRREQLSRDRARPGRVEPGVIPHSPLSPRPRYFQRVPAARQRRTGRRRGELGRRCAQIGTTPIERATSHHLAHACMRAHATS